MQELRRSTRYPLDLSVQALRGSRLARPWFARDAKAIARELVGSWLVHEHPREGLRVARVVETEAYRGPLDLACHARAGLTRRTRSLLGEEGHAYVFLVYGMHECFNVTCLAEGAGHAVLLRAGEPVAGVAPGARLDGPGRLARAMGLSRAHDGQDLTELPVYLCPRPERPRIAVSPRVGVGYAGPWADAPLRFYDAASPHVSRPPRSSIGSGSRAR